MTLLSTPGGGPPPIALPGLKSDNLLALLASLGLLRAVEEIEPKWQPRLAWSGNPHVAMLHLSDPIDPASVAETASRGVSRIAASFERDLSIDGQSRDNVKFTVEEWRSLVQRGRSDRTSSALLAALSAELPDRDGATLPSPLVFMFGQGHQHFLKRLFTVPVLEEVAAGGRKRKPKTGAQTIEEALFTPWRRTDRTDGFRWDPAEDQRYALRFGDPGKEGAAPTVHGANRLAAIGLLSLPCFARSGRSIANVAFNRTREHGTEIIWPIWSHPLPRAAIETLIAQTQGLDADTATLFGVDAIMRARRVSNTKMINISVAREQRSRR